MPFSANDLNIVDPHDAIRRHPLIYTGQESPSAAILIGRLVTDITTISESTVFVIKSGNWWRVGATHRWLNSSNAISIRDYFLTIVPFPEAGLNAFHAEVLLGAFASHITMFDQSSHEIIKGEICNEADELGTVPPGFQQWVAFRFEPQMESCRTKR